MLARELPYVPQTPLGQCELVVGIAPKGRERVFGALHDGHVELAIAALCGQVQLMVHRTAQQSVEVRQQIGVHRRPVQAGKTTKPKSQTGNRVVESRDRPMHSLPIVHQRPE